MFSTRPRVFQAPSFLFCFSPDRPRVLRPVFSTRLDPVTRDPVPRTPGFHSFAPLPLCLFAPLPLRPEIKYKERSF